jgi:hypothetical protein
MRGLKRRHENIPDDAGEGNDHQQLSVVEAIEATQEVLRTKPDLRSFNDDVCRPRTSRLISPRLVAVAALIADIPRRQRRAAAAAAFCRAAWASGVGHGAWDVGIVLPAGTCDAAATATRPCSQAVYDGGVGGSEAS